MGTSRTPETFERSLGAYDIGITRSRVYVCVCVRYVHLRYMCKRTRIAYTHALVNTFFSAISVAQFVHKKRSKLDWVSGRTFHLIPSIALGLPSSCSFAASSGLRLLVAGETQKSGTRAAQV